MLDSLIRISSLLVVLPRRGARPDAAEPGEAPRRPQLGIGLARLSPAELADVKEGRVDDLRQHLGLSPALRRGRGRRWLGSVQAHVIGLQARNPEPLLRIEKDFSKTFKTFRNRLAENR